jgi:transcription termination factor Rho
MTAEQQLERSVLESKERDELHAIAQAMALKTTTRTKKADIIDRILEATGVTAPGDQAATSSGVADGNGARPAARRGRTAASAPIADGTEPVTDGETSRPAGPSGDGDAAPPATTDTATDAAPVTSGPRADRGPTAGDRPTEAPTEPAGANGASSNGHGSADATPGATTFSAGGSTDNRRDQPSNGRQDRGSGRQPGPGQQNRHNNNAGNQQGNIDAGNRRGRRRRGRERGPTGERGDLQGGTGQEASYQGELVEVRGLLDLRDEGYGFLRCDGYLPSSKDVYVSISQARRFALRKGDYVEGACRPASNNEKYPALLRIDSVSGLDPEEARQRPRFEDLTPLFPDSQLVLENPGSKENVTARIVDLLAPIGRGQRGLIVSPPKAGKTTVMKQIAHSIEANNPDVHLMVLLVDERPEEVTDMRRSVNGEVVASTFDRPSDEHTTVAELAIERAKRLVEQGRDVVIILDGITRLARAYNLAAPATGRIMSGGVDSGALYPPKKFFGAARNIEEGGSLTILATALVETGSKMDEVIFEEFKGTGNMELRLDRRLAERRLYPAIDVNASSTRHEELLFDRGELQQVWKLRRVLNALASDGNAASGLELLMDKIRTTKSNDEFLAEIAKGPTPNN